MSAIFCIFGSIMNDIGEYLAEPCFIAVNSDMLIRVFHINMMIFSSKMFVDHFQ